jgi:anti-sigma regulatory factor (Ser/Thr protein kinase)
LNKHYRATITSDIRNVAKAREGVADFALDCGFAKEAVADVRLAAGEALSNAVEHVTRSRSGRIIVDCSFDGSALTVAIHGGGPGFPAPSDQVSVQPNDRGRGFGIFLMRRLMDEVSFARNGAIVRLRRRI